MILLAFTLETRAEQLGIDAEQTPATQVKREAVGAERGVPSSKPWCIDDLVRVLSGRLVTDVVIAGQRQHPRGQGTERRRCKRELCLAVGPVDRDIAIYHNRFGRDGVGEV